MPGAIKTVLVPLTGLPGDADVLRGAVAIARGFGAHLAAVHVRPGSDELAASLVSAGAPGAAAVGTVIDDLIEDSSRRGRRPGRRSSKPVLEAGAAAEQWNGGR